jgi:hypothetical protein
MLGKAGPESSVVIASELWCDVDSDTDEVIRMRKSPLLALSYVDCVFSVSVNLRLDCVASKSFSLSLSLPILNLRLHNATLIAPFTLPSFV